MEYFSKFCSLLRISELYKYCDLLSSLVCRQFDIILHSHIDHISWSPYESTASSCSRSHTNSLEKRYRLPIWTNMLFCSLKKRRLKDLELSNTCKYYFAGIFSSNGSFSCLSIFPGKFWVISRTVKGEARNR